MRTRLVVELECKNCGNLWVPMVDNPKKCPQCQSRKWNEEKDERDKKRGRK